jgi:hypothetical protein
VRFSCAASNRLIVLEKSSLTAVTMLQQIEALRDQRVK